MEISVESVSVSSVPAGQLAGNSLADDAVLFELTQLWESHRKQGLEDRHRTGVLLNTKFGDPTGRQTYGDKVFKQYSDCLSIEISELSRMRWFAHRFTEIKDLRANFPDVKTWTQVRELLASLRTSKTNNAEPKDNPDRKSGGTRVVDRVIRAMRTVQQCISEVHPALNGDECSALREAVEGMLTEIGNRLGVRYTIVNPLVDTASVKNYSMPNSVPEEALMAPVVADHCPVGPSDGALLVRAC
jgi:hypothetical protein